MFCGRKTENVCFVVFVGFKTLLVGKNIVLRPPDNVCLFCTCVQMCNLKKHHHSEGKPQVGIIWLQGAEIQPSGLSFSALKTLETNMCR